MMVRDEEDIIQENILYHLACGVDFFIVVDHKSTDSTPVILKNFESRGVLHYIRSDHKGYQQSRFVTMMARMAKTKYNADWVINNDADEFWYVEGGNLKAEIEKFHGKLNLFAVERHNFIFLEKAGTPFYQTMTIRERDSSNPAGGKLFPKVIHRGCKNVTIREGGHEVGNLKNPFLTRILRKSGLLYIPEILIKTFHFPNRSKEQIIRKVWYLPDRYKNVEEIGDKLFDLTLEELTEYEGFNAYLKNIYYSSEEIEAGLSAGTLIRDERFMNFHHY